MDHSSLRPYLQHLLSQCEQVLREVAPISAEDCARVIAAQAEARLLNRLINLRELSREVREFTAQQEEARR